MVDVAGSADDLHLGTVVINVQDMRRAVEFWTAALVTRDASGTGIRSS
jgi:hypothetical protein